MSDEVIDVMELRRRNAAAQPSDVFPPEQSSPPSDSAADEDEDYGYIPVGDDDEEAVLLLPSGLQTRKRKLTGVDLISYRKRLLKVTQGDRKQLERTVDVNLWFSTKLFEFHVGGQWVQKSIDDMLALDGEDVAFLLAEVDNYGQSGNSQASRT